MKRGLGVGIVVMVAVAFAFPLRARAQNTTEDVPDETVKRPSDAWLGPPRAFVASTVDAGYLYARPRLSLGYGRPFSTWVGIDVNPLVTNTGYGGYGGARFAVPFADLRVGAREFLAFNHNFLEPKDHYGALDLNSTIGDKSRYLTLEAELSGAIQAGPGSILFVLTGSSVRGVREGLYVYEETLRVIVAPPWIWRTRLGYAVRLGREGNSSVGVVGEVLGLPGRHEHVFRAGIVASFAVSRQLEALFTLVPPILSPDTIGIAGGDIAQLGIRFRWATGLAP
jgi:hypothetical protein